MHFYKARGQVRRDRCSCVIKGSINYSEDKLMAYKISWGMGPLCHKVYILIYGSKITELNFALFYFGLLHVF
jgi:hypothetical protein